MIFNHSSMSSRDLDRSLYGMACYLLNNIWSVSYICGIHLTRYSIVYHLPTSDSKATGQGGLLFDAGRFPLFIDIFACDRPQRVGDTIYTH
jgi:hypothetical protein